MYKEKLRLRAYGVPKITDTVYFEIKKKAFGIVNKRRTAMKLGEAYKFIKIGDYMNKQVVRELDDFLTRYKVEPKLYLAYDRIAYFEKNNPDLRISFDTNIRSRRSAVALEYGDFGGKGFGGGFGGRGQRKTDAIGSQTTDNSNNSNSPNSAETR